MKHFGQVFSILYFGFAGALLITTSGCRNNPNLGNVVASYSVSSPGLSEVVYLRSDMTYLQRQSYVMEGRVLPYAVTSISEVPYMVSNKGTWRLLNAPNGRPLALPLNGSMPPDAVVEIEAAYPFGYVLKGTRPSKKVARRNIRISSLHISQDAQHMLNAGDNH